MGYVRCQTFKVDLVRSMLLFNMLEGFIAV